MGHQGVYKNSFGNACASQDWIEIWKCWFLRRGENQSTQRKTSWSRVENQQQTQPTYDTESGNWSQDIQELLLEYLWEKKFGYEMFYSKTTWTGPPISQKTNELEFKQRTMECCLFVYAIKVFFTWMYEYSWLLCVIYTLQIQS